MGINLSSLLFIVYDSITLSLFKRIRDSAGKMNVVPNTKAKHISVFMNDTSQMPDTMNIINIHVGNKMGCNIIDINWANLFISRLQFFA